MGHTEFGFELLEKVKKELSEVAEVEREEKLEGRNLTMILTPRKGKKPGLPAGRVMEDAESKD